MKKYGKYIDLHIHTNASDGTLSAEGIIRRAKGAGLCAIAITDHDSIDGVKAAVKEGKKEGIEVISGVELTVDDTRYGIEDIHIVGLFIDTNNKDLIDVIKNSKRERLKQKKAIVKKLRKLGYKLTFRDVKKIAKGEVSRLHIAKVLLRMNDCFEEIEEVFDKLIGLGKIAYIGRKNKLSIKKAVSAIHKSNGIAILAHPYLYDADLNYLINIFVKEGGDGLEVYYPYNCVTKFKNKTKEQLDSMQRILKDIALKKGLVFSGGSDFHYKGKNLDLGDFKVPYFFLSKLKKYINRKRTS